MTPALLLMLRALDAGPGATITLYLPKGTIAMTATKKTISPEQRAKMKAAMEARKEARQEVIRIGVWEVFEFDADNWVLRKGDSGEYRYYPNLPWALKALLHEDIGARAETSIAGIMSAIKQSESAILAAVAR
jgi:hypothetical protein